MYSLSTDLWNPQACGVAGVIDSWNRGRTPILYGPTGCGKTRMAQELFQWAEYNGLKGVFYVNRNLLVGQTLKRFQSAGLHCGARSAIFEDEIDYQAPFQVASVDTERARVWGENAFWSPHDAQVVIVDEAHLQKSGTMGKTIELYRNRGAKIVLMTASPVGMAGWANDFVRSGTMQEYRDCGALVMARLHTVTFPDLKKIKRAESGEYVMDGKTRKIFTQHIVGDVIEGTELHNPDLRPFLVYAPGKPDSVFLAGEYCDRGIRVVHVDATEAVIDRKRYKLNRAIWDDIVAGLKDGSVKGVSSRFKLREGVDLPFVYHECLATPIGSLQSYVQTVGRVLRRSAETPDEVVITDHGGNYLEHGSPNAERPWDELAWMSSGAASRLRKKQIELGVVKEPFCCPKCGLERPGGTGFTCPNCGSAAERSARRVMMEDGTLELRDGLFVPPLRTKLKDDTQKQWDRMYYGYLKRKHKKSFEQMYAYFRHVNKYAPPRNLKRMPKKASNWLSHVHTVEPRHLYR